MIITKDQLLALMVKVKDIPITEKDRQAQALSFAFGNLNMSTNHKPSRQAFIDLARSRYGWSVEEAEAWAAERTWDR